MNTQELQQFSDLIEQKNLAPKISGSNELKTAAFNAFLQAFLCGNWPAIDKLLSGGVLDLHYLPKEYRRGSSDYHHHALEYLLNTETVSDDSLSQFFSLVKNHPSSKKELIYILNKYKDHKYITLLGEQMAIKSFKEIKSFYDKDIDDFFFKGVLNNPSVVKNNLYKELITAFPAYFSSFLVEDEFLEIISNQSDISGVKKQIKKNKKLLDSIYGESISSLDSDTVKINSFSDRVWNFCFFKHNLIPRQKILYAAPTIVDNIDLIDVVALELSNPKKYSPDILKHFKDCITLYYRFSFFCVRNKTVLATTQAQNNLFHLLGNGLLDADLFINAQFDDVCSPNLEAHQKKQIKSFDTLTVLPKEIVDKIKLELSLRSLDNAAPHPPAFKL